MAIACNDALSDSGAHRISRIAPSDDEKPEAAITDLVQGSPIGGAAGIISDSKDQLHIASIVGREIVVMDLETGEIRNRLGPDVGVRIGRPHLRA